MDDDFIIAAYSIIADSMRELGQESHCLAKVTNAEILTVAVVAAKFFQNHQERPWLAKDDDSLGLPSCLEHLALQPQAPRFVLGPAKDGECAGAAGRTLC